MSCETELLDQGLCSLMFCSRPCSALPFGIACSAAPCWVPCHLQELAQEGFISEFLFLESMQDCEVSFCITPASWNWKFCERHWVFPLLSCCGMAANSCSVLAQCVLTAVLPGMLLAFVIYKINWFVCVRSILKIKWTILNLFSVRCIKMPFPSFCVAAAWQAVHIHWVIFLKIWYLWWKIRWETSRKATSPSEVFRRSCICLTSWVSKGKLLSVW